MSNPTPSRRRFLQQSSKATIATGLAITGASEWLVGCSSGKKTPNKPTAFNTGFQQKSLPYPFAALAPSIDAKTMEIHYTKHAAGYSTNLQDAAKAEGVDMSKPLELVLQNISKYSVKMRNNGGGHFNHELFWQSLTPNASPMPSGEVLRAIESSFQSFDAFKNQFSEAAKSRFGSGWAWLLVDANKQLRISSTPNQDNPLMDIAEIKGYPLLGLDVWEHAYYLQYQNKRADYINNFWKIINWDFVQSRYALAL